MVWRAAAARRHPARRSEARTNPTGVAAARRPRDVAAPCGTAARGPRPSNEPHRYRPSGTHDTASARSRAPPPRRRRRRRGAAAAGVRAGCTATARPAPSCRRGRTARRGGGLGADSVGGCAVLTRRPSAPRARRTARRRGRARIRHRVAKSGASARRMAAARAAQSRPRRARHQGGIQKHVFWVRGADLLADWIRTFGLNVSSR